MKTEKQRRKWDYGDYGDDFDRGYSEGHKDNLARDLSYFEEPIKPQRNPKAYGNTAPNPEKEHREKTAPAPRKKAKIIKIPQKKLDQLNRRHHNPFLVATGFVGVIVAAFVVIMILYGQAQITELNQKISNAESDLQEMQSYGTQMEMKLRAKSGPTVLEEFAKANGMEKAANDRQEQINLSEGDKASIMEEESDDFFSAISKAFNNMWE